MRPPASASAVHAADRDAPRGKISIAVLFLHPGCNMRCSFCVTEDDLDSMSFGQAVDVLTQVRTQGVRNVVLGGGEPFAWKHDLVKLTRHAKDLGFFVQVGTNGIAMPDNFEHIESIDRYVMPLDAMHADLHDRMRQYRESHHAIILDRLHALQKAEKSVTMSTVITRRNIQELQSIGAFLQTYHRGGGHLHAWHLYRFLPLGRGGRRNACTLEVADRTFRHVCRKVKGMQLEFPVFQRRDLYHSDTVGFYWLQHETIQRI